MLGGEIRRKKLVIQLLFPVSELSKGCCRQAIAIALNQN